MITSSVIPILQDNNFLPVISIYRQYQMHWLDNLVVYFCTWIKWIRKILL